jgi:hypothetical protein
MASICSAGRAARVITGSEVCVTLCLGRTGHVFQIVMTVAGIGLAVQVFTDVSCTQQLWQPVLARSLDLSAVLAYFRFNVRQPILYRVTHEKV